METGLVKKMVRDFVDIPMQSAADILQPRNKPRKIGNNKRDWRICNDKSNSNCNCKNKQC